MPHDSSGKRVLVVLLAAGLVAQAGAKVVFTGYADFRITPHSTIRFDVPPSLAASSGVGPGRFESRTAALDSLGLFAANTLSESTEFLLDVTYRDLGYTARTIRLQYAYLAHTAWTDGPEIEAGKIMLPFGRMNRYRYYSFQQPSVTPPTFLNSILGLPIADLGVSVRQAVPVGPVVARIAGFAVNGYGPLAGTKATLRNPSLPGGLTIAGNLTPRDANKKPAGGGKISLSLDDEPDSEIGGSIYAGHWDAAGRRLLQMANAHALVDAGPINLLVEYLYLHAEDDQGFAATVGAPDWRTDGGFATVQYQGLEVLGRPFVPWARAEEYRTRGVGGTGHERLRAYAAGAGWTVGEGVMLKVEANQLIYGIPWPSSGRLAIDAISCVLGLAVSF